MLEIFDQNPSSRVFHVDDECYVLYLGAHWDDYKPFLRLGSSANLPEKLPPIVSTIVVPDTITGSPLTESVSLAGGTSQDTHYLGDVRTVNKLKKFLKLETIPVEGLKRADHETDDNTHVYVYSYKDGNLKIKYHKNEIFDLHRRERQDSHFLARAQEIKNEFGKGPFKLPADAYKNHGFAVVSGAAYLVADGEIAALGLSEDYFPNLAAAGIDPDRITTVRNAAMDEATVRFLKRSRVRNRVPKISTANADDLKGLAGIFRANTLPALKISTLPADKPLAFHKFTINERPGPVEVRLQGLEGPIIFGAGSSKVTASVSVNPDSRVVVLGGKSRPLLDGCIYQFAGETLSGTLISERYLPEKNYPYRDMLSQNENNLVDQMSFYFSELFAGRDAAKVLRTIRGNPLARDLGKSGRLNPVTEVIIANTAEYIRYLQAAEREVGEEAAGLASLLEKRKMTAAAIPPTVPLTAEISFRDGVPFVFYRIAARITSDRMAHGQRVYEKILTAPQFDFQSERNRLAELVDGLADPDQMEEARLRRIAEREKPKKKEVPPKAAEDKTDTGRERADAARRRGAGTGTGTGRRRSSRGGAWRWIVPVAVVLLLLAILLALLATNTIPNKWFGRDDVVAADSGVTGTDVSSQGDADSGDAASQGEDGVPGDDEAGGTVGAQAGDAEQQGDGSGADEGTSGQAGESDGTGGTQETGEQTILPEGWPPETLPAIIALEDIPGVQITADRVTGPGGIEITVMDIIILVNRVATENGYAPMHVIDPDRPDPDWIYPGNLFVLPNGTRYTVVQGDTLWDITVRYMVARLGQDYARYVELTEEYTGEGILAGRQGEIIRELQQIGEESHSENFTKLVGEKIAEWRE